MKRTTEYFDAVLSVLFGVLSLCTLAASIGFGMTFYHGRDIVDLAMTAYYAAFFVGTALAAALLWSEHREPTVCKPAPEVKQP